MTAPSLRPSPSTPAPPDTARAFRLSRRCDRTGRLLGDAAMERLARARVIVFGLGGVGSYAVEGLVRSGVGHLTLVDFDDVCVTNLNRQLHATVRTVGKSKAELMAQRCREINPDCAVEAVAEFYRAETCRAAAPAGLRLRRRRDRQREGEAPPAAPLRAARAAGGELHGRGGPARPHGDPRRRPLRDAHGPVRQGHPQAAPAASTAWTPTGGPGSPRSTRSSRRARPFRSPTTRPPTASSASARAGRTTSTPATTEPRSNGSVGFVTSVFGMNAAGVVVRRIAHGR